MDLDLPVLLHHAGAPHGRADARQAGLVAAEPAHVAEGGQPEVLEVATPERSRRHAVRVLRLLAVGQALLQRQ